MSDPWLKFYPTDWRSDPALRMCSAAARGVWIDLICLMHQATPYGHLLVNGRCPTDAQVAVLTGTPPDQLSQCLRELEEAGVFSRTKDGTIYSRKLTRMAKKAALARNNGRKGGNPSLGKKGRNSSSDNPQDKGGDKPQKLEARNQIREEANASSLPRKRATRLPAEWALPAEWGRWAVIEGWPESVIRSEADKFRDYWIGRAGKDAAKLDWQATWRNWMRNSKAPKIVGGGGNEPASKSAARLHAFIHGAD